MASSLSLSPSLQAPFLSTTSFNLCSARKCSTTRVSSDITHRRGNMELPKWEGERERETEACPLTAINIVYYHHLISFSSQFSVFTRTPPGYIWMEKYYICPNRCNKDNTHAHTLRIRTNWWWKRGWSGWWGDNNHRQQQQQIQWLTLLVGVKTIGAADLHRVSVQLGFGQQRVVLVQPVDGVAKGGRLFHFFGREDAAWTGKDGDEHYGKGDKWKHMLNDLWAPITNAADLLPPSPTGHQHYCVDWAHTNLAIN